MYAHALTYPSLRTRRVRRLRTRRRAPLFSRNRSRRGAHAPLSNPRHHMRALARRKAAASVSWGRELLRMTAALANVAGWAAFVYFVV